MDLRTGGGADHTPTTSAIGLAVAVMMGSEPETGADPLSAFLDSVDPPGVSAAALSR
jgi:hypothetical protein